MKIKVFSLILVVILVAGVSMTALAGVQENAKIKSASIRLSTSMSADFICSTRSFANISVYSVTLEVKNSNGTWSSAGSLSSPSGATDALSLNSKSSYSSSCTKGKTYRIKATFDADGETVSRTSNEATYK